MRKMIFKAGLLATVWLPATCFLSPMASADNAADNANASPVLIAKNYFNNDVEITAQALEITKLDLAVSMLPGYAETTATVEFYNPTQVQLEGEFLLDLPTGSMITGYALDIDGEMIDGVLVEKKKAKKAFENRIRQGIDPGLAEMTRENAFKNRVFPILPRSSRTIKVTFLSPISRAQPYRLPLITDTPIKHVSIEIGAEGFASLPVISLPGQMQIAWSADGTRASAAGQNMTPNRALTITPQQAAGFALERQTNGQRFLSLSVDAPEARVGQAPDTIRIYWDTSLSSQTTLEQQQVLLQTLATFGDAKIDLVPFASAPQNFIGQNGLSPDTAIKGIGELSYNGATNLEALYAGEAGRDAADICLLVSDGRATLGHAPLAALPCKLFTLSGADDADRGVLQMLAQRSGGQFIDTRTTSAGQLETILTSDTAYLKSVKIDDQEHKDKAIWSNDGDQLRLLLPVPEDARGVKTDFGAGVISKRLSDMPAYTGKRLGAAWADQWLVQAAANGASRDDLVALSQTYSVASEVTSFLVLESMQDYVAGRVALPASGFTKAQRAEYTKLFEAAEASDRAARETRLAHVVTAWRKQIEWYEASYSWASDDDGLKILDQLQNATPGDAGPGDVWEVAEPAPPLRRAAPSPNEERQGRRESVTVTGSSRAEADGVISPESEMSEESMLNSDIASRNNQAAAPLGVISAIEIRPWTPERPYLDAVTEQCGSAFETIYLDQRGEYGGLPSFYLEMADARAKCGDIDAAAEIALSALDLDAANTDTMSAVANRLLNYGRVEIAVGLLTQITEDDPDRPQPWRDLALALELQAQLPGLKTAERRALYSQAIGHLNHIIETPWGGDYAPWDGGNDRGELIAVMEANRIAERLRKIGGSANLPDQALERLLDVDLRVVVTWNTDIVDMDLWVNEPTGERSYYGYALTQIGGRLSNDITDGYGPEEYLLKQALPGDYAIRMHYYGSDIINPNGAVTLRAHIYRNWGRDNQSVSVVDFEFSEQGKDNYLVAELKVE